MGNDDMDRAGMAKLLKKGAAADKNSARVYHDGARLYGEIRQRSKACNVIVQIKELVSAKRWRCRKTHSINSSQKCRVGGVLRRAVEENTGAGAES